MDRLIPEPGAAGIDGDTLRFVVVLGIGLLGFMLGPWTAYHARFVPEGVRGPLAFALVIATGLALLAYGIVGFPSMYPSG